MNINVNTRLGDLSVGQRQMIEIAKALLCESRVIIMDEPTAALTHSETKHLFEIIENLKKKKLVLFIFLIEWRRFFYSAIESRCYEMENLSAQKI